MAQFMLIGICSNKCFVKSVETSIRLREKNLSHSIYRDLSQLNIYGVGAKGNQRQDELKRIQSLSEVNEKIIFQVGIFICVKILN